MYTVVVGHTKEDEGITDDITNDVEFVTTNGVDEFATCGVLGAAVVALITNR